MEEATSNDKKNYPQQKEIEKTTGEGDEIQGAKDEAMSLRTHIQNPYSDRIMLKRKPVAREKAHRSRTTR